MHAQTPTAKGTDVVKFSTNPFHIFIPQTLNLYSSKPKAREPAFEWRRLYLTGPISPEGCGPRSTASGTPEHGDTLGGSL